MLHHIFRRPTGKGLLTVSNHQSILDDPGLWAAVLPFWRVRPEQLRWTLCTEDVFFFKRPLQNCMAAGNVLPLDRTGLLDQPMFRLFLDKLRVGAWCHIFAEGKVWQNWRFPDYEDIRLGSFKHGVGKLVAHSYPNVPIVLPMFHMGMDSVLPEKPLKRFTKGKHRPSTPASLIPKTGKKIAVFFGEPIDFTGKVQAFEKAHPGLLQHWQTSLVTMQLYEEISREVREKVLLLEAEAYGRTVEPAATSTSTSTQPVTPASSSGMDTVSAADAAAGGTTDCTVDAPADTSTSTTTTTGAAHAHTAATATDSNPPAAGNTAAAGSTAAGAVDENISTDRTVPAAAALS